MMHVCALVWIECEQMRVTFSLPLSVRFITDKMLVIFAGGLVFYDRLSTLA